MLNRAKPLTNNNNSWAEEGQEKPKNQPVNQKGALRKPFWEEQSYKMLRRTTKPLWKRVLIEEGQAKSSKKQHSENTDKWHLRKAGSFSYGESPRTPPLEGTSLHRWKLVWRDPGGSWACLPPVYKCNQPATVCDTCGIHPKQHTKKRGALGNAKKMKNHKKKSGDVGRRSVWIWPKRKHSEWKEPNEMLHRAKPLQNNNSLADEGQKKKKP